MGGPYGAPATQGGMMMGPGKSMDERAGTQMRTNGPVLGPVIMAWQPLSALAIEHIPADAFAAACESLVPLYSMLFPSGFVADRLKTDLTDHIAELRGAITNMGVAPSTPLTALIEEEVARLGGPRNSALSEGPSATHGVLWLCRTAHFISAFCQLLGNRGRMGTSPNDLAREAYAAALRPYHGMLVSGIVRAAMSFVPSRDALRAKFGYTADELAMEDLAATGAVTEAVAQGVLAWMQARNLHFPDAKARG